MRTWIQRAYEGSRIELRLAKKDWDQTATWLRWLHYFAFSVAIISCVLIYVGVI